MTSTRARTLRFYQGSYLVLHLSADRSLGIVRHQHLPLALRQDRQGMVLACDAQDSVLYTRATGYTPYGHQAMAAGSAPLAFTGEIREPEIEGYLLGNGHRAFSPALRRFYSPDSLSPFGKGGVNAYAYCAGDPVNNTDPDGRIVNAGQTQPTIFTIAKIPPKAASQAPQGAGAITSVQALEAPPPSYRSALTSLPKSDPALPPSPKYTTVPEKGHYTLEINMGGADATSPITQSDYLKTTEALSKQHKGLLDILAEGPKNDDYEAYGKLISTVTAVETQVIYTRIAVRHRWHITEIRKGIANHSPS